MTIESNETEKKQKEGGLVGRFDLNDPVIEKALELAGALSRHCKEHNLPKLFVIDGVAPDAEAIAIDAKERGYIEGKAYEKGRMAELLGLAT